MILKKSFNSFMKIFTDTYDKLFPLEKGKRKGKKK